MRLSFFHGNHAEAIEITLIRRSLASDEQRRIAEDAIADVNASGLWPGKAVTEVAPVGPFWEAEPEHQDYLERFPDGYTCHFIRPDWKLPQRSDLQRQGAGGVNHGA
jgi:peptide-methionine (S)-S-oxide reductase